MKKLINLTPHPISLLTETGDMLTIAPEATPARVAQTKTLLYVEGGISFFRSEFGEVMDLPEPQEDTIFIVSALIRSACPERADLASPADLIRDSNGAVIGASGLYI